MPEKITKAGVHPGTPATGGNHRVLRHFPRFIMAAGDVAVVLFGVSLGFVVRFGVDISPSNWNAFLELAPWLAGSTLLVFAGLGLYDRRLNGFVPILRGLLTGVVLVGLATATASYWFREFAFPRSIILIGGFIQLALLAGWRWFVWRADCRLHGQKRLLVLGTEQEARAFLGKLWGVPSGTFCIVDIMPPDGADQLAERMAGMDAAVVMPSVATELRRKVLAAGLKKGLDVYLVPSVYEVMVNSARVSQIDDLPVLQLEQFRLSWFQALGKRLMDVSLAAVGLIVGLPVLVCLAVFVVATSPGSPFYVQERVCQNGRVFRMYKLRTMAADAERHTGPVLAAADDPRVTRVGRLLRTTRLDELPQLFNVLKGDMSIVGPRPERPEFVEEFITENPAYQYRHFMKPGLTGLAQVRGRYDTSAEDKLSLDLYYISNYSLLLDLQILLQTIPVVLTPSAARGRTADPEPNTITFVTNR